MSAANTIITDLSPGTWQMVLREAALDHYLQIPSSGAPRIPLQLSAPPLTDQRRLTHWQPDISGQEIRSLLGLAVWPPSHLDQQPD